MKLEEFKEKYYVIAKVMKDYGIDIHDNLEGLTFTTSSPFEAIMRYEVVSRRNNSSVYIADTNDGQEALDNIIKHFDITN